MQPQSDTSSQIDEMLETWSVERFLISEARLLDERRLEAWQELFTSDGTYRVTGRDAGDPESTPSVVYDNADMRRKRVVRLLEGPAYAQLPPSETVHAISNVQIEWSDSKELLAHCALTVHETRSGDYRQLGLGIRRAWAGRATYRLSKEGVDFLISQKVVQLIGADQPFANMTIIL